MYLICLTANKLSEQFQGSENQALWGTSNQSKLPDSPSGSLLFSNHHEVFSELQLLLTNTIGQRIGRLSPARPAWLFEIHSGGQQTTQWQKGTLWLLQWPHDRTSTNGPFAFRWKERNQVIWTGGPNGGAAVKHLTIKQVNCGAAVSLSGKWIQWAVPMIPSSGRGKDKRFIAVFTFQSDSRCRPSDRPGKTKKVSELAVKKIVHSVVFFYCGLTFRVSTRTYLWDQSALLWPFLQLHSIVVLFQATDRTRSDLLTWTEEQRAEVQ